MFPDLKPNRHIAKSLKYNENKVQQGKAERIGAENFLTDARNLTKEEILARFRQRSSLNERLHDHGLHVSLNFGKRESIENGKLVKIADRYMEGLGFEDQPYVTYQHRDAGHPHLHIVASSVRADGSWLSLQPEHYRLSHRLCREIETEFSLEKSKHHTLADQQKFAVDHAQRVAYGDSDLKNAISNVLNTVVDHYNFTSLDEFNAILKQYNVNANPGLENSRLNKMHGLLYHALDNNGNRIGPPLKASGFLLKPTLNRLEQQFQRNQSLREPLRQRLHTAIEWALAGRAPNWPDFTKRLEKDGIALLVNKNTDGKENLFFIDHQNKSVFASDHLGADQTLQALRNRCAPEEQAIQQIQEQQIKLRL
jgi:hypothetical protein